jgi:hypothetical protein
MFGKFPKKALGVLLGLAIVATSLVTALPAMAAGTWQMTLTGPAHVNAGQTFDITINANISGQARNWQTNLNYTASQMAANSVTEGTFLSSWASAHSATSAVVIAPTFSTATTGSTSSGAFSYYLQGGTGGPTGTGTLAVVRFTAAAGYNGYATITLSSDAEFGDTSSNDQLLTNNSPLQSITVAIGNVPMADLTVTNVTTSPVHSGASLSGDPTTYNVSFQVNNVGNADAGASVSWVAVNGGSPIALTTGAITQGNHVNLTTATPITNTLALDAIVVTADATGVIAESNETNNTASATFNFQYPVSGQQTDVYGGIVGTLSFTQPASVNMGSSLVLGPNTISNNNINVISNQTWTITAQGLAPTVTGDPNANVDAGKMTKLTGTTYNPYIKLHNQLAVGTSGGYLTPFQTGPSTFVTPTNASLALTGTPQTLAMGIPEGQQTSSTFVALGETRGLAFQQVVFASDPSLVSGSMYDIQVNFQASATAW